MVVYAFWWIHFFYWFNYGKSVYPNSCGAANGALVVLTLLIVAIYSVTLIVLALTNTGQKRTDYLIFLALVLAPILYLIGYMSIEAIT